MKKQANTSAKSKEVQSDTQSQHNCTTFAFALTPKTTYATNSNRK